MYEYFPEEKSAIDTFLVKVQDANKTFGLIWKIKILPSYFYFDY